jgi:plasmid stabilization system protein ParE
MIRPLVFHPEARQDVGNAAFWYEDKSAGLGSDFLRSMDAALAQIRRTPQVFPVVDGSIRRALLRRFPYAVYFVDCPDQIRVLACMHVRQNPDRWQRRA